MSERRPLLLGKIILVLVASLLVLGLIIQATLEIFQVSSYRTLKQALWVLIGFAALYRMSIMNYRTWPLIIEGLIRVAVLILGLLVALTMFGVFKSASYIPIGPFSIQPSELFRPLLMIYVCHKLTENKGFADSASRAVPIFAMIVTFFLLVAWNDLGTAATLAAGATILLLVPGIEKEKVAKGVVPALGVVALILLCRWSFVQVRLDSYLSSYFLLDIAPLHHQLKEGLIAIVNGGFWGQGLIEGTQKFGFVPEASADFIYCILIETFGVFAGMGVVAIFIAIFCLGMGIGLNASDRFGCYLAISMSLMIFTQAMANIAIVLGILPITGINLVFVSYGGSSLLANLAAVGVLLSVERQSRTMD